MFNLRRIQDRRVVRIERDDPFGIERHARFATLAEGDRVALAGAEVVVYDDELARLALFAREREAILHLDDHETSADERVIARLQRDAADDFSDSHAFTVRPFLWMGSVTPSAAS